MSQAFHGGRVLDAAREFGLSQESILDFSSNLNALAPTVSATEWEQWAVDMKAIDGTDAGTEVIFKMSTDGGTKSIVGLLEAVKDRIESGQRDGNVVPIFLLEKDSYQHSEFGRVWYPVLTIVDWMSLDGPAPASAPKPASPASSAPTEQPGRRRVG